MRHILIDYESHQPPDLATVSDDETAVVIFVGPQQHRLPFTLVDAMQRLGSRGSYVKVAKMGHNALDFHLAFYLGERVRDDPGGVFRIVSKDSGFDPLIAHLQARGLDVARWLDLDGQTSDADDTPARLGILPLPPQPDLEP